MILPWGKLCRLDLIPERYCLCVCARACVRVCVRVRVLVCVSTAEL